MECIILAGGLGTRLQGILENVPKCMATIDSQPFLAYLLSFLEDKGFDHVILSLGYQHEKVINWLNTKAFLFKLSWVIESEPLGTGGGLKLALKKSTQERIFVINGDTFFNVDFAQMKQFMPASTAAVIALKPMLNFDRYGNVIIDEEKNILGFEEKKSKKEGLINGGVVLINTSILDLSVYPDKFSLEKEIFEKQVSVLSFKAWITDSYFIDIGIPKDYAKAQEELPKII